jgi:flagellar hook-length control protein FliK
MPPEGPAGQALDANGGIPPEIVGRQGGFAPMPTDRLTGLTKDRAGSLAPSKSLLNEVSLASVRFGQAAENEPPAVDAAMLEKGGGASEASPGDSPNQIEFLAVDSTQTTALLTAVSGKPDASAQREFGIAALPTGNPAIDAPPTLGQMPGNEPFRSVSAEGVVMQKLDLSSSAPSSPEVMQDAAFRNSEQYQLLADRVSAAIGKRILAEVSLGTWKLDIQLHPAHLGKIDVRLSRRVGGPIEAEFSASETRTMELLLAGLPKLKEVMSLSGLDMASLNVRDQGSSTKENGSSGKQGFTQAFTQRNSPQVQADEQATAVTVRRANYIRTDGLDVTI